MATLETRTVETDEAGMRLDRWFKSHYPELSFGHLQKLLRSGQIRVDGGRVKTNARLAAGQAVRVPPLGQGGLSGILRETGRTSKRVTTNVLLPKARRSR
jgi:23S rRNA pseudouridine955/2504/2580 synthase